MNPPKGSDIFFCFCLEKGWGKRMKLLDIYEKSDMFRSAKGGEGSVETASLFACGMICKEIFFPALVFEGALELSLEQMWYLLCLHHDKRMENPKMWKRACAHCRNRSAQGLEEGNIAVNREWQPMRFVFSPLFYYAGDGIRYDNGICVRKCLLAESEVKDYFYFRNICYGDGGMDHGIAGGLLLYENLICRRMELGGELDRQTLNLYSYAANTLLVHNLCEKKEGWRTIRPDEDPLLLLLVLAETIEPLQYAKCGVDYHMLLQAVEIDVRKEGLTVRMNPAYFDVLKLENKISRLKKIVRVNCEFACKTSEVYIRM